MKAEKSHISTEKREEDLTTTSLIENEPYKCTGRFIEDFQNICKRNSIDYTPQMIHRNKIQHIPIQNIETKTSDVINFKAKPIKGKLQSTIDSQSETNNINNLNPLNQLNQKNNSFGSNDLENIKEGMNSLLAFSF